MITKRNIKTYEEFLVEAKQSYKDFKDIKIGDSVQNNDEKESILAN